MTVGDKIHILYGRENTKYHLIYNITKNKLTKIVAKEEFDALFTVSLTAYKNELIVFGGFNNSQLQYIDSVKISTKLIGDVNDGHEIKWIEKNEWKLPIGILGCDYILYKHYMIIFGGCTWEGNVVFLDSIYLLDLESNDGWKELHHIKCPIPSKYIAVLDNYNHI